MKGEATRLAPAPKRRPFAHDSIAATWPKPRFRTSQRSVGNRASDPTRDLVNRSQGFGHGRSASRRQSRCLGPSPCLGPFRRRGVRFRGRILPPVARRDRHLHCVSWPGGLHTIFGASAGLLSNSPQRFNATSLARICRMSTMSPGLKNRRFRTVFSWVCEYSPLI